ncbi:replication initiator protein A (plasmid) [Deinococcus sp. KNUC1210]|uniref:replication initiator protein A n=1 Tax=Deinococcus sp. KNUC1210 TaxID=2917691 RepID=UPI001EEF8686|nr:replication initiator protein A [Deinococcus sp. KNUC1210]ULH17686.1 replication initiator protein A [Deinococcus sp. KNUC1210]
MPHGIDVDTSAVINNLFLEQGCPADNAVTCTAYALLQALQLKDGGTAYAILRESLLRLSTTTFLIEGWVQLDARGGVPMGKRVQTTFRLLERITQEQLGLRADIGRPFGSGASIRTELPREVAANIRARHVKPLDLNFMLSLESVAAQVLFRMLDAVLHDGSADFEINLLEWGQRCRSLDLRPDKVRRVLQPAHDELMARAYLKNAEFIGREQAQTVRSVFQAQRPDHPLTPEQVTLKGRIKALGVTDGQAERFVRAAKDADGRVALAETPVRGCTNLRNPGGFAWDVLNDRTGRYVAPPSGRIDATARPQSAVPRAAQQPLRLEAPAADARTIVTLTRPHLTPTQVTLLSEQLQAGQHDLAAVQRELARQLVAGSAAVYLRALIG